MSLETIKVLLEIAVTVGLVLFMLCFSVWRIFKSILQKKQNQWEDKVNADNRIENLWSRIEDIEEKMERTHE